LNSTRYNNSTISANRTQFQCVSNIQTPVRRSTSGRIQCLSVNGKRCRRGFKNRSECQRFVRKNWRSAKVKTCKASKTYSKKHWCSKARRHFALYDQVKAIARLRGTLSKKELKRKLKLILKSNRVKGRRRFWRKLLRKIARGLAKGKRIRTILRLIRKQIKKQKKRRAAAKRRSKGKRTTKGKRSKSKGKRTSTKGKRRASTKGKRTSTKGKKIFNPKS
jgi:hypothetical protein